MEAPGASELWRHQGTDVALGLHRLDAYAAEVDELGARSADRTKAIMAAALDAAGPNWPACSCGGESSLAGVPRGSDEVIWRCASCAHAAGWRADPETGEIDFGADAAARERSFAYDAAGRARKVIDIRSPLL